EKSIAERESHANDKNSDSGQERKRQSSNRNGPARSDYLPSRRYLRGSRACPGFVKIAGYYFSGIGAGRLRLCGKDATRFTCRSSLTMANPWARNCFIRRAKN